MEKSRNKFILILTAVILITGFGLKYLTEDVMPQFKVSAFTLIPVFFYIIGLALIYVLTGINPAESKKLVNKYMLLRVIKVLTSLVFLLIFWLINKAEIKNFALLFIVFYMIYLIFETWMYLQVEKMMKKNGGVKNDLTEKTE
jgi:L-asparagine transporter-like permease